jgi:hypothetical protein
MINLVTIEGVLAKGDDLRTAQPHKFARVFYEQMRLGTSLILMSKAPEEIATWWLKREHMPEWARLLCWNQGLTWDAWRLDQVRQTLSDGWEVLGFVDSEPSVVEQARMLGVPGILVSYPDTAPGWKDQTQAPRPWGDVVSTLDTVS